MKGSGVTGKRGWRPPKYGAEFVKLLTARLVRSPAAPRETAGADDTGDDRLSGAGWRLRHQQGDAGITLGGQSRVGGPVASGGGEKAGNQGVSTTRAVHTPLRSQIPVRAGFERYKVKPGFFACDTAAHRGG
ncbi:MAG: hypothetical protein LBO04_01445, partial [Spirochaetaceae bacterium]|nr:hypothetical protein [Spirochaetaceae bacterium]